MAEDAYIITTDEYTIEGHGYMDVDGTSLYMRIYGTPPNPYDSTRLAGGSSSGSAAALGYGLCTAALGTDTGGSVRAPAALCGLVGFKPTFGRISTDGVIPYSWTLDHIGTLTRSAADAAILFEALADSHRPAVDCALENLSIGIPRSFFYQRCAC